MMANLGDETVSFTVDGMGCAGCATGIETTLRGTPGVRRVEVDFATRLATVSYDSAQTNVEALAEVIAGEGYTVAPAAS